MAQQYLFEILRLSQQGFGPWAYQPALFIQLQTLADTVKQLHGKLMLKVF